MDEVSSQNCKKYLSTLYGKHAVTLMLKAVVNIKICTSYIYCEVCSESFHLLLDLFPMGIYVDIFYRSYPLVLSTFHLKFNIYILCLCLCL